MFGFWIGDLGKTLPTLDPCIGGVIANIAESRCWRYRPGGESHKPARKAIDEGPWQKIIAYVYI